MPKSTMADGLVDKQLPITVVDLSEDAIIRHIEQKATLSDILETSTDNQRTLRWINIRSPHWHVARALAEQKKLDCLSTDSSPSSRMPPGVNRCSNCIRICFMMLKLAYPPARSIEMSQFTTGELNVDSEPVFMYITPDNTIITLFEDSAMEIETCILKLLEPPKILGQPCDAYMLAQAIIDAAVDRVSAVGEYKRGMSTPYKTT
ncbi:hypothetical protein FDECE_10851 [Fusarium decemcellulare]|nr:hypothetical protein FDECE_10851 [Fusarium decemcellulare]